MIYGDDVETLEERVMSKSSNVNEIFHAMTRIEKVLPQIYKSQAHIACMKAVARNQVFLKEQEFKFDKRIANLDSWEQFETKDERDEYLRSKSHEWVLDQSDIFVENVINDMKVLTNRYRTPGGLQTGSNVSRANKYMV